MSNTGGTGLKHGSRSQDSYQTALEKLRHFSRFSVRLVLLTPEKQSQSSSVPPRFVL